MYIVFAIISEQKDLTIYIKNINNVCIVKINMGIVAHVNGVLDYKI